MFYRFHCCLCWCCLFGSNCAECREDSGVDCSCIVQEGAHHRLNIFCLFFVEGGGDFLVYDKLCLGSVLDCSVSMRGISDFVWCLMLKLHHRFWQVSWHVGMDFAICIVPFNGKPKIFCCFFVHSYLIIFFQCFDSMLCIVFTHDFIAKSSTIRVKVVLLVSCIHSPGMILL